MLCTMFYVAATIFVEAMRALSFSFNFPIFFFSFSQVTTKDGIQARRVELTVVTPEALILADEEIHINSGTRLDLVCILEKSSVPPQ